MRESLLGRGVTDPISATAGNFLRAVPFAAALSLALSMQTTVDPTGASPFPMDESGRALFFGAPASRENRYAIIDFTTSAAVWTPPVSARSAFTDP